MTRLIALLALAVALVAIGVAAVGWMLDGADAPPRAIGPVALDADAMARALDGRARTLQAADAAVQGGELDGLLAQDPLELEVGEIARGGVTLRDVVARRTGGEAAAEATVDPAEIAALAPGDAELAYDADASARAGGAIVLTGSAGALGIRLPVRLRIAARDGAVVASPEGLPFGEQVLFDDPRVRVTRLVARPAEGGALRVRAEAQVAP